MVRFRGGTLLENNDLKFRNHLEIDLRTDQSVQLTGNSCPVSRIICQRNLSKQTKTNIILITTYNAEFIEDGCKKPRGLTEK